MANPEHLAKLREGVEAWDAWREKNPDIRPDLFEADLFEADLVCANLNNANLTGADLCGADLTGAALVQANLRKAKLEGADLTEADLQEADLREADLNKADLSKTHLVGANLGSANLNGAILNEADLGGANLGRAKLRRAHLVGACLNWSDLIAADLTGADLRFAELRAAQLVYTNLTKANLENCWIHGISAWNLQLGGTIQSDLVVTAPGEPKITVDNIEVAQFIYLLLSREKLRDVIQTITSKAVLILGRFTPERKAVLDAIANELRRHNLLPIIFDFERAKSRDFTETIKTLAGISLFVIADITNPKSAPLELQATVPDYKIPFVPILEEGEAPFAMFEDLKEYEWVLPLLKYPSLDVLIKGFKKAILEEAFEMHKKLLKLKAEKMETRRVEDYIREPT
jgi:uncharacterized protein YjbI with pentapeptide repeats